jgi:hypothetical protein
MSLERKRVRHRGRTERASARSAATQADADARPLGLALRSFATLPLTAARHGLEMGHGLSRDARVDPSGRVRVTFPVSFASALWPQVGENHPGSESKRENGHHRGFVVGVVGECCVWRRRAHRTHAREPSDAACGFRGHAQHGRRRYRRGHARGQRRRDVGRDGGSSRRGRYADGPRSTSSRSRWAATGRRSTGNAPAGRSDGDGRHGRAARG